MTLLEQEFNPSICTKKTLKITKAVLKEIARAENLKCEFGNPFPLDLKKDTLEEVKILKKASELIQKYLQNNQ